MGKTSQHIGPPRWILWLFRWFCHRDIRDDIEGDLYERWEFLLNKHPAAKAKRLFFKEVVLLFRPNLLRDDLFFSGQKLKTNYMVRHNTLVSLRNFKRNSTSFFINLIGLTVGLTSALMIYLWIDYETSIDKFHAKDDRLFKIKAHHTDASGTHTWDGVSGLILNPIQENIPGVEYAIAETQSRNFTFSTDKKYIKADMKFGSEDFFETYTYQIIARSERRLLDDLNEAVITRSFAEKLFGTADVVGKTLEWHFGKTHELFRVSAVIENPPLTSSESFEILLPWDYYHDKLISYKQWGNYYARISMILEDQNQEEVVEKKLNQIFKQHNKDDNVVLSLEKYSDDYLYGNYINGEKDGGRIAYVNLFSIVAGFILLIACINFMNLATARATARSKEVHVKKTLGASKKQIIFQYYTESFLISLFATTCAALLVWLLLPFFNQITSRQLVFPNSGNDFIILALFIAITTILAGSYPSFYMSGLKLNSYKNASARNPGDLWIRKSLVVFQFVLSILLISGVLIVQDQMSFIQNKNLGFNRQNVVYFEREGTLIEKPEAFIEELRAKKGIEKAALSEFLIGGGNSTGGVHWPGKTDADQIQFWEIEVGIEAIELLDIDIKEGRAFSTTFGGEEESVLINEAAVKAMGIEKPVGMKIRHYSGPKVIVGVVEDFHLISLHTKVEPMIFLYEPHDVSTVMVKLDSNHLIGGLESIEDLHEAFNPGYPMQLTFLDQDYQKQYASEQKVAILSKFFAGIAILISCLGLFGLATFTTERRYKEIGIRKTLGADRLRIVWMLTREFGLMVLIAVGIAIPISFLIGSKWLENFAYHTDLSLITLFISVLLAIIIALLTVGGKTYRAASIDPAKCLKDE